MNRITKKPKITYKKRKRIYNKPDLRDPVQELLYPRGGIRR